MSECVINNILFLNFGFLGMRQDCKCRDIDIGCFVILVCDNLSWIEVIDYDYECCINKIQCLLVYCYDFIGIDFNFFLVQCCGGFKELWL